ncbi:hypothetical protein [Tardiphaga sp.]|jgi:hypothetical protein|uniref:hypothetical protein n=1 Tax=Tardiphaga sp. TaxID=1926292 RepID=UPI0037D9DD7B
MDWSIVTVLALVGIFIWWRQQKHVEGQKKVAARLARDTRLYQHIKMGMREYDWRQKDELWDYGDRQVIFETPHLIAYHVSHFAETRIGFYFKDIEEYGLYGFFAGNGDEHHESYYRSDKNFLTEGRLAWGSDTL